jgi:hypothetical protein
MRAALAAAALYLFGVSIVGAVLLAVFFSSLSVKQLEHDVTLEFADPRPGFTYFLVCRREHYPQVTVERLTLTDGRTARVNNDNLFNWSTVQPLRLCAMPNDVAKDFNEDSPDFKGYENRTNLRDWFDRPEVKLKTRWSGELGEIPDIVWGAWNPQHTIVRRYRVEHTPAELKVELVEERVVNSWSRIVVVGGAGLVAFLLVAWLWCWLLLKWRKAYCKRTASVKK